MFTTRRYDRHEDHSVPSFHHVNVLVPPGQTDAAVRFYLDVLHLRRIPKPAGAGSPRGAWLDIGDGSQLHISERSGSAHPDAHFALLVDDFDAVLQRLSAAERPWTAQSSIDGSRRGFTRDPAGNRVELMERARPD